MKKLNDELRAVKTLAKMFPQLKETKIDVHMQSSLKVCVEFGRLDRQDQDDTVSLTIRDFRGGRGQSHGRAKKRKVSEESLDKVETSVRSAFSECVVVVERQ